MPFVILAALIFGGVTVYLFLNPSEKIKKNEISELETLDSGYGGTIQKFLTESGINERVVERFFYLKHKYNLTKTKK